ncbi:SERTA domain-containing protein 2-like [Gadus chalcogrammus]|uniref:SERTA domain-containing protein 2-like n=1 Tax=Gadus chalcogrammus TaxID=1042646 RepID=UPI0024C32809|nr:SERTA domain-containing protein 2-like [Gadus chalcogrammus]
MWGPGVKRKLEQDQDGEEEDGGGERPPPPRVPGFSSRASYALQRQMVLNISLVKLYRPPAGRADPGLQRRILISNVIRRIHDDLRREGGVRALFLATPPPGVAELDEEKDGCYLGPPPPPPASQASSFGPTGPETCLTPASLLEEDPPPFFTLPPSPSFSSPSSPHPLPPQSPPQHLHPSQPVDFSSAPPSLPPEDSFSSALEEIEELDSSSSSSDSSAPPPLVPLPTSSPPGEPLAGAPGPGWDRDMEVEAERREEMEEEEQEEEEEEEERELMEYRPTSPPRSTALARRPVVPSGGFLTDFAMDDVLFTDIDTSMYDLGPCGPQAAGAGPGAGAGPTKVAADDMLVRAISGYGGGAGGHQGQPFRMDLAELDHIMEVLVGS